MSDKTDPHTPEKGAAVERQGRQGVLDTLANLRFSGLTLLLLVLVIGGVSVLSGPLSVYVKQRNQIKAAEESIAESQAAVDKARAHLKRWQDPAYIKSQARNRLFYVLPGESQLSVINDIKLPPKKSTKAESELSKIDRQWTQVFLSSVVGAAKADKAAADKAAAKKATEKAAEQAAKQAQEQQKAKTDKPAE